MLEGTVESSATRPTAQSSVPLRTCSISHVVQCDITRGRMLGKRCLSASMGPSSALSASPCAIPRRISPDRGPPNAFNFNSAIALRTCRQLSNTRRPSGVRVDGLLRRSSRTAPPIAASKLWIRLVTAGWVKLRRRAARLTEPVSAKATKASISGIFMRIIYITKSIMSREMLFSCRLKPSGLPPPRVRSRPHLRPSDLPGFVQEGAVIDLPRVIDARKGRAR